MRTSVLRYDLFNALLPARPDDHEPGTPRVPRVQMREAGDSIEQMAELPGIDPDDELTDDDVLTLRGETRKDEERDGQRIERHVKSCRQLRLPEDADANQAQASYENGILTIRFSRTAGRSNVRRIPISTESREQRKAEEAA